MRRLFSLFSWFPLWTVLLWGGQATPALAQAFAPSGPVTVVVPFAAGGPASSFARALAKDLEVVWKQPVIVENVPGAGGGIGAARVARSAPDGRTLLFAIGDVIVQNRFIFRHLPYDPDKDFAPIAQILWQPNYVLATASLPANNMKELIDLARRTPGGLAYSSSGIGSSAYFIFETLAKRHSVEFVHVPYKGQSPAMLGLAAGEVMVSMGGGTAISGYLGGAGTAPRIKALAVGGAHRTKLLPDVPTLTEAGPGFDRLNEATWMGVFAPARTNAVLVDRINKDINGVVTADFVSKYMTATGEEPALGTPAQFAAMIKADVQKISEMARVAGLKPQD